MFIFFIGLTALVMSCGNVEGAYAPHFTRRRSFHGPFVSHAAAYTYNGNSNVRPPDFPAYIRYYGPEAKFQAQLARTQELWSPIASSPRRRPSFQNFDFIEQQDRAATAIQHWYRGRRHSASESSVGPRTPPNGRYHLTRTALSREKLMALFAKLPRSRRSKPQAPKQVWE